MLGLSWSSIRARALPALTTTAHITAPFIGTFLLIHLSAPALASIGGASMSSQAMLLGREYYQTPLSEPLLLLIPLSLHVLSAQLKRLLGYLPPKETPFKSTPPTVVTSIRPLTHPLTLSALVLAGFLPIHYFTHRVYPTISEAPILSVGPAELDFSFVQTGLQSWPVRSVVMYIGLVCAGVIHAAEGVNILRRKYLSSSKKAQETMHPAALSPVLLSSRLKRNTLALAIFALPALAGIYALAREPTFLFADLAERYRAVFTQTLIYQL